MSRSFLNRDQDGAAGFTLVEALIAFAMVALASQAAIEIFATQSERRADAAHRTLAISYADTMLAQLGNVIPLKAGNSEGIFDDAHQWRLTVTQLAAGNSTDAVVVPYSVSIDVSWAAGSERRVVHFQTVKISLPP